ncbi:MAG TPA: lipoprotein insertase outer membrane protein LolB [Burkholderiales bacterium]|nr:lipoprotein insertase outer membrane protein LolB [Burkholderiales bacterium]
MRRAAAAALILAAGCAQAPLAPPEGALEFQVLGRIGARYGNDGFTGNVDWRHARAGDDMLITTPLGEGLARIVRAGDAVQLTTANGKQYNAPDAETLTERVLGFRVPLEGMTWWVRGRPMPDVPFQQETGPEGRLRFLQQSDWRIAYLNYDNNRPKLLQLNYPGIQLRFAITEWNSGTEP